MTVATPMAVAEAVIRVGAPSATDEPLVGAVMAMVGTEVATVTLTAAEVTTPLLESVTRAVSEKVPVAVGVQLTVDVAPEAGVLTVPTRVVPAKKSTFAMVPLAAVATALKAWDVPTLTVEPPAGAVSTTVGAVTLTLTIVEVTTVPFESVTLAVSAVTPETEGVQVT